MACDRSTLSKTRNTWSVAKSGDLAIQRQVTWGMSDQISRKSESSSGVP
jgi:hypothetical protein